MASRVKSKTVNKFGGVQELGSLVEKNAKNAPVTDIGWDAQSLEVQSDTKLQDDTGEGKAAIIRCFEFGMNPLAFSQYQPTKQELFNSHYKFIETRLWADGLKVMPDVNPRVVVDGSTYRIFVGAEPMKGHILRETPQTLSDLVNG